MLDFDKVYTGWSFKRLSRHVLYWSSWLLFFAVMNANYKEFSLGTWLQVELVIMLVKLPYTYFVIYFLVPRFLLKKQYLIFAFFVISLGMLGGFLMVTLDNNIINPIMFANNGAYKWELKIGYKILDLIYIASLPTILKLLQWQRQQEKQTQDLAEGKLRAELQLLKNQLHPHFLFNTLNNLYGMVLTQDKKSPEVVLRLSEIMSYMLYECDKPLIKLEKELDHLNNYIELEKIRHGKRVDLTFEKSGGIEGKSIPPLLLIPFVENAFKHGVENSEKQSWIRINIWVEENKLEFMVENSIPECNGTPDLEVKMHSGIGLENVRRRLTLLYPEQHQLIIQNGETYFVKLVLSVGEA